MKIQDYKNKYTQEEAIGNAYDYIVNVTKTQNRLLPVNDLYGDGTRWNCDKKLFTATYNKIKEILKANLPQYIK